MFCGVFLRLARAIRLCEAGTSERVASCNVVSCCSPDHGLGTSAVHSLAFSMIVIYAKSKQKKYCANQLFTKVVPASGLRGEGGDGGDILLVFLIFNRNLHFQYEENLPFCSRNFR